MASEVPRQPPGRDPAIRALIVGRRHDWPSRSFLAQLPEEAVLALLERAEVVSFSRGDVLMAEGDVTDDLFCLLEGCCKVTARSAGGGEALLAVRVGGDLVGELASLSRARRVATVRACARQPVLAAVLPAPAFAQVQAAHPVVSTALTRAVARKLSNATRRRADFSGSSPLVRVARTFVWLAEEYGRPRGDGRTLVTVALTQDELASLINASVASVQRSMRTLRRDHIIDSGRHVLVRDMAALRRQAQLD